MYGVYIRLWPTLLTHDVRVQRFCMHALSLQLLIPYSLNRPEVYSGTDYYRVNTNDLPNLLRTQVCMVLLGVSLLGV